MSIGYFCGREKWAGVYHVQLPGAPSPHREWVSLAGDALRIGERDIEGEAVSRVAQDGVMRFRRLPEHYDVTDRECAFSYIRSHSDEVLTGVIYADESVPDMHEMNNTPEFSLTKVPMEKLCPGSAALGELMADFR